MTYLSLYQSFSVLSIILQNRYTLPLLNNNGSIITMVIIFSQLCVPIFHFSVRWFSVMQFGVIYLKTWGSTQPCCILNICILFSFLCFWWNTHGTEFSYTAWASVCCVLSQVSLVGSWMGFVFRVLHSDGEAPLLPLVLVPSPTSVWTVGVINLNHKRWQ